MFILFIYYFSKFCIRDDIKIPPAVPAKNPQTPIAPPRPAIPIPPVPKTIRPNIEPKNPPIMSLDFIDCFVHKIFFIS